MSHPHLDLDMLPDFLTVEEAGRLLRISRGAAYEAVRMGQIRSIRVGRTIRVPRAALADLLTGVARRIEGNGPEPSRTI